MKDFFGMTREQFRKWLERHIDSEPDCGILACSPEIYAEMMAANEKAMKENVDNPVELHKHDSTDTPGGGTEGV